MLKIAEVVLEEMKANNIGVSVKEIGEDIVFGLPYEGMLFNLIFTGKEGEYLTTLASIDAAPSGKEADAIFACNSLNARYKWTKFYLDKSNNIMIQNDAILEETTAYSEAIELMLRTLNILKEAKPTIMRTLYS